MHAPSHCAARCFEWIISQYLVIDTQLANISKQVLTKSAQLSDAFVFDSA